MREVGEKKLSIWWLYLALLIFLTFLGRYLFVLEYPTFWQHTQEAIAFDIFRQDWSLLIGVQSFLFGGIGFSILSFVGMSASFGILWKKIRTISLIILSVSLVLIFEVQHLVYHVGDTLLLGVILCLLCGKKHKWTFIQILIGLLWLLSGIHKIFYGNWFSGEALVEIGKEVGTTYQWFRTSLEVSPLLTHVVSFLTPLIQTGIGISMFTYLFTHNKHIRVWGCFVVPLIFMVGIFGTTVGLLPLKAVLCSTCFFFPSKKLPFPKKEHVIYVIPVLYLLIIAVFNLPFIRFNGSGNYFYTPFTYIQANPSEMAIEKEMAIKKHPWLFHRYARFYEAKKGFYESNTIIDCEALPKHQDCP